MPAFRALSSHLLTGLHLQRWCCPVGSSSAFAKKLLRLCYLNILALATYTCWSYFHISLFMELFQESSLFVFKLGGRKLHCYLLRNSLFFDSSKVLMSFIQTSTTHVFLISVVLTIHCRLMRLGWCFFFGKSYLCNVDFMNPF